MSLLDTLPITITRRQPSLAPAIDLLEAVLGRTSLGIQQVLNTAPVRQIVLAVEVLLLTMIADTGIDLDASLIEYLRDTGTIREIAFVPCDDAYAAGIAAGYAALVDEVAAPRTGIYRRPSRPAADTTGSAAVVGYGYALAAVAVMRMAITDEDVDTLVERYRIADAE